LAALAEDANAAAELAMRAQRIPRTLDQERVAKA
jgi:hypothetical protein